MGMAAMLVMWPRSFEQLFFPKSPGGCIWNLVAIGPVVSEEKSFEIVDGRRMTDGRRTDDGRRTTEPAYTISSPGAFGSGELKKKQKKTDVSLIPLFLPIPLSKIRVELCKFSDHALYLYQVPKNYNTNKLINK